MGYQLIEEYTLGFTGGPLKAKGWAIHWWGDPANRPTFDGIRRVLQERSALEQASVNFMAEAGKVACLVDPFTVAWGQGDGAYGWGNNNLVSVECNPRCTAEDRETVAELIADQHIENGIPIVLYPHKNFTSTACPGVWEQWIPWLTERAKQIVIEKTNGKQEEEMALSPEEHEWLKYIVSPDFKKHIFQGTDPREIEARAAFIREIFSTNLPWYGFDGNIPAEGRKETNLGIQLGWLDTQFSSAYNLIRGVVANSVELTEDDIEKLAESLKASLSAELAADLAKRLAE